MPRMNTNPGEAREWTRTLSLCILLSGVSLLFPETPALADHPFDPRRYAFEVFSEDERMLSNYSGVLDESEMAALLSKSWAELDSAADRATGLPPEQARIAIREEIRKTGGVSENFETELREKAEDHSSKPGPAERLKTAARHPLVWAILALFALLLFFLNRPRRP